MPPLGQKRIEQIISLNDNQVNDTIKEKLKKFQKPQRLELIFSSDLKRQAKQNPDIADIVFMFLKNSSELQDFSRYQILTNSGMARTSSFDKLYFDTNLGLVLTYDAEPVAFLGFDIQDNMLKVLQIQGVKGKGDKIKDLNWEKLLIYSAQHVAKDFDLEQITVRTYKNISYEEVKNPTIRLNNSFSLLSREMCEFRGGGYWKIDELVIGDFKDTYATVSCYSQDPKLNADSLQHLITRFTIKPGQRKSIHTNPKFKININPKFKQDGSVHYDKPAKELGYTFDNSKQQWIKPLRK